MAKYLQILFNAKEPLFTAELRSLERRTGNRGADVAYIANIMQRAHATMRKMGLDTADTTPLELYRTLNAHVENEQLFKNMHDVYLVLGKDVISFNHDDVKHNTLKSYEQRKIDHVRHHVAHGLTKHYQSHGLAVDVVKQSLASAGVKQCKDDSCAGEAASNVSSDKNAPYVLCIGDIFSDVFIKLNEHEARIDTEKDGSKRLSLPFGSKPPYDAVETVTSVGPSPNAGVSMARLGLRVGLMSWLGDDVTSKNSLAYLTREAIDTAPLVIARKMVSNIYYVLRYGADRTILVKNEQYDYSWKEPKTKPDWVYLSLVSAESWHLHQDLIEYLEKNPEIKLAFQPGTFHFKWGAKKLAKLYRRSEIVVMNREEAVEVTGASYDSLKDLADALHALGPKYVVITDGPSGSYASFEGRLYQMPNYPDPAPPVDRTGAGDAFASTIVAALALGKSLNEALTWAPINSMSVVQKLGAQAGLLRQSDIKKYLKSAPKTYTLKEMK